MDVISVHVPKTAGTSFRKILATVYGEEHVLLDYKDVPMNPNSPYQVDHAGWREAATAEVRSIGPEFRAIHGHFSIEKYNDAFPEARRIAWVRHPAAWVISLYFYWKHVETTTNPLVRLLHAGGLSIDDFARHPAARDQVSGIFLRGASPESFDFLGVQEHFEDDSKEIVRMMGWPEADPGFMNKSPEEGYEDRLRELHEDDRLVDRLMALNEGDMAFYEGALKLRARRLEQSRARAEKHARLVAIRERVGSGRREDQIETA
jgi:hypothetical protein